MSGTDKKPATIPSDQVDWNDLRALESIDRLKSMAAAARELGMSLSTLYRRIAVLEDAVGEVCLVRGGDGALTDVGVALARVGKKTRGALSDVRAELHDRDTALRGEVSLTTVHALLPFIEGAIADVCARHPGLSVIVHLGDDGPSVRDREVDVALAIMPRPPPGCFGRRVARRGFGVYGTAAVVAARPTSFVARALEERHSPESAWERANVKDIAARAPFAALVSLCAAGAGVGLMPHAVAARHPQLVEVEAYRQQAATVERVLWVLTHPDRRHTPRIAALVDAVAAAFA